MKIQVLYVDDCPNYMAAMEAVRSVAPQALIEAVRIESPEQAARMRFLGSPTILVDGVDVEPAARKRRDFGIACRTYNGSGVPSRELLASATGSCFPPSDGGSAASWFAGGSALAAVIASACCWLPLVLLGLGMSTVGIASTVESYRPWLLAASVLLLGAGFYSAYWEQACCTSRSTRLNRAMVWIAAALVLVFAFFPVYADALLGSIDEAACCASSEPECCALESGTPSGQKDLVVEPKTPLTVLSDDARELKDAFNADKGAPRVLLIVSPLCPACRDGASVVQKEALARVDSDKLKVYVVWINRFPGDSLKAAQGATALVGDKRVLHFWDGSGVVGRQFGQVVQLPQGKKFAWDIYFVFDANAQWKVDPPKPAYWMHQLGGSETGNVLDGEKFREAIARQLRKRGMP